MDKYTKEGTVIELKDTVKFNDYFSKREFKIRYTEQDLSDKIVEQKIKLVAQDVETIDSLDAVRVDDQVKVSFYITGKDVAKKDNPEIIMNFTTLVAVEVEVMGSPTRDTKADKNAVITKEAKVYKDPLVEATMEELAGLVVKKEVGIDPLLNAWDKKKDRYGLVDDGKGGTVAIIPADNPFGDLVETNNEPKDLPF